MEPMARAARNPRCLLTKPSRPTAAGTVLAALLLMAGCGPDIPPTTGTVERIPFRSDIVGQDYVLHVRVPPDYDDDTAIYPLVVQLDPTFAGLREFDVTAGLISQHAAAGDWAEAVVAGIDYAGANRRDRDYLPPDPPDPGFAGGQADDFYRALRDEILPFLEDRYRIDPARRTLVGHSNGARFVWYAAFRHRAPDAPLFAALIASDTAVTEDIFNYETWYAAGSRELPLLLYSARATDNGALEKLTHDWMAARLAERDYAGLVAVFDVFRTDHGGIVEPSFERGLGLALGVDR